MSETTTYYFESVSNIARFYSQNYETKEDCIAAATKYYNEEHDPVRVIKNNGSAGFVIGCIGM